MKRLFSALMALPLAAGAADYHADPVNGSDSNDGRSAASAFRSLERAVKELKAGDTLNLAPGAVFHEALVIDSSGTPSDPIVIKGNGAVVSGAHPIDPGKWVHKGADLWFQPSDRCWGALRPRVYIGDEMICPACGHPNQIAPDKLSPRTAVWQPSGIYFRAEAGKTPRDYRLLGGAGRTKSEHSGVIIVNRSYITVDDLVAERFPNDGFNIHGTCRGLLFRDIVARHNGDDGFSVHADIAAAVIGLHSHHNDYGIQDAGYSQLTVSGAILEYNRLGGFDEYGGIRILRDSVIRGNGRRQIGIYPRSPDAEKELSPLRSTMVYLEKVKVEGGEGEPLFVAGDVTVVARGCSFTGTEKGPVFLDARVHLEKTSFSGCGSAAEISPKCNLTTVDCKGLRRLD